MTGRPPPTPEDVERYFWAKVRPRPDDCFEWAGAIVAGYGRFNDYHYGGYIPAHRYAMMLRLGEHVPKDTMVLHHCDNKRCVNSDHLFLGDHKVNMRDMVEKGRSFKSKGEKNNNSKLTDKKVRLARRLRALGWSYQRIANCLGLKSGDTISLIINGKAWTHVGEAE